MSNTTYGLRPRTQPRITQHTTEFTDARNGFVFHPLAIECIEIVDSEDEVVERSEEEEDQIDLSISACSDLANDGGEEMAIQHQGEEEEEEQQAQSRGEPSDTEDAPPVHTGILVSFSPCCVTYLRQKRRMKSRYHLFSPTSSWLATDLPCRPNNKAENESGERWSRLVATRDRWY